MLFLDDFLEMLEELPAELKERSEEIRRIDVAVEARLARNREAVSEFLDRTSLTMTEPERQARYKVLQDEFAAIRAESERKFIIAEKMQELLKKYKTHLEKEKTNFQCEMEADNSGVTEMIEKRYTQHVEQTLVARKERKRRHRNGNESSRASSIVPSTGPFLTKESNDKIQRILQEGSRLRMDISDDSAHSAMSSAIPSPAPRGRPPKTPREPLVISMQSDDGVSPLPTPSARRRSNTAALRGTVSIPSAVSTMNRGESSGRYSPNPSERSWSNAGVDESPTGNLMTPTFSSGPLSSTAAGSGSGGGLLQNSAFVVSESRHGRTRKLTSRVQEMFKETLQRQRNHGNSIIALQERMSAANLAAAAASHNETQSPTPGTTNGTPTDDEEEGDVDGGGGASDDDEDEDNEDARHWCFCNEKSYGEMVRCDNPECSLRWFHYPCIGMVEPPPKNTLWYCPRCVVKNEMAERPITSDEAEDA